MAVIVVLLLPVSGVGVGSWANALEPRSTGYVSLGLLAAILGFVPYIGPVVAAIPAVLLALLTSQMQAVHVVLLYLGVQLLESYFLTPLVQKKALSLPPALTLTTQMLMGVLVGTLGVMLAAPLTATVLTVIKTLSRERSNTGAGPRKATDFVPPQLTTVHRLTIARRDAPPTCRVYKTDSERRVSLLCCRSCSRIRHTIAGMTWVCSCQGDSF
jgi:hypothetical protein